MNVKPPSPGSRQHFTQPRARCEQFLTPSQRHGASSLGDLGAAPQPQGLSAHTAEMRDSELPLPISLLLLGMVCGQCHRPVPPAPGHGPGAAAALVSPVPSAFMQDPATKATAK